VVNLQGWPTKLRELCCGDAAALAAVAIKIEALLSAALPLLRQVVAVTGVQA
jgi:hypothetical protein